jgi:spermidine/putrescine transport system permease protein
MKRTLDPFPLYAALFLLFLYGPVLLMPVFSFNDNLFATFPLKSFTFKHYTGLAATPGMIHSLQNSLSVGLGVSVLSTILGLLAAIAFTRYPIPFKAPVSGMILLPLVVPSVVLGVALLVILRRMLEFDLSLWTVGAGHLLLCVPFSMLVLISRLEGFDRSLEEASSDLGETAWMTFWRVTFPLALPGIIASLIMSFTISFDEFVLAFFLSGTDATLPVYLFSQLRFPQYLPRMLALGSSILVLSAILVICAELLRQRGTAVLKPWGPAS